MGHPANLRRVGAGGQQDLSKRGKGPGTRPFHVLDGEASDTFSTSLSPSASSGS